MCEECSFLASSVTVLRQTIIITAIGMAGLNTFFKWDFIELFLNVSLFKDLTSHGQYISMIKHFFKCILINVIFTFSQAC